MTNFKYIWRNATRNGLRSTLTILSVGFSLAMLTVLYGYLAMQDVWANNAKQHNRIVVMNVQGFSGKTPIAYVERIASTDGLIAAVPYSWFGGVYKDERMPFAQFGTDAKHVFDVWPEYKISQEELDEFKRNRRACVVDRRLAERRTWKVGERIPLKGTFYPIDLELELVGIFDTEQPIDSLWFHWEYMEESLKQAGREREAGNAGTIFAKAESASAIPGICRAIDDRFANSDNPTRTQTEAAFAQMFSEMLGNIQVYIRNIALVVVFSLTLVAANAMAMAMRERTTEIAVLKAIGFPRLRVLNMILGESCFISGVGGFVGLAVGCGFLQVLHSGIPQFFPFSILDMAGPWMLLTLLLGFTIGVISGIVPAIRAAQLSVVNGLRRVV